MGVASSRVGGCGQFKGPWESWMASLCPCRQLEVTLSVFHASCQCLLFQPNIFCKRITAVTVARAFIDPARCLWSAIYPYLAAFSIIDVILSWCVCSPAKRVYISGATSGRGSQKLATVSSKCLRRRHTLGSRS